MSKIASRLEAPPAMVRDITKWVLSKVATEVLRDIERLKSKYSISKFNQVKDFLGEDLARDSAVDIWESERIARRYGGKTPSGPSPRTYEAEFPLDFSGWKYRDLVKNTDLGFLRDVKVIWYPNKSDAPPRVRSFGGGVPDGTWDSIGLLRIYMSTPPVNPDSIERGMRKVAKTIRHELQHLSQDVLEKATGSDLAGRAPGSKRDVLVDGKYVEEHAIRGVEFYTRLEDDIQEFLQLRGTLGSSRDVDAFTRAAKVWVGASPRQAVGRYVVSPSEFFVAIKNHDPRRYRKAVSEFWKAVSEVEPSLSRKASRERGPKTSVTKRKAGSCPVRSMHYGGLPSDGGFRPIKEFGVGLTRAFEAAHCVLGSLGRHLGKNRDDWSAMIQTESGHLNEEIGIIRDVLREYSRPIYRNQMMSEDIQYYLPEDREQVTKGIERQVNDIRRSGPKLSSLSKRLGKQFASNLRDEGAPEPWTNLALSTYLFVKELADASVKSVQKWPDEIGDPFSDPRVTKAFSSMENYFNQLLRWRGDSRRGSQEGNLNAFMAEYERRTFDNPIDPRMRVWSYRTSEGEDLPLVMTEIRPTPRRTDLASIWFKSIISPERQGVGQASHVLKRITEIADKHGVSMWLNPVPFGTVPNALSSAKLKSWYKRHGWEMMEGRRDVMIRKPKGSRQASVMDQILLDEVHESLNPYVSSWVFGGSRAAKIALLDAYKDLSDREKSLLLKEIRALMPSRMLVYRSVRPGQPLGRTGGISVSDDPATRTGDVHVFSITPEDVLLHYGQKSSWLSSNAYRHEREIILKPDARPKYIGPLDT